MDADETNFIYSKQRRPLIAMRFFSYRLQCWQKSFFERNSFIKAVKKCKENMCFIQEIHFLFKNFKLLQPEYLTLQSTLVRKRNESRLFASEFFYSHVKFCIVYTSNKELL